MNDSNVSMRQKWKNGEISQKEYFDWQVQKRGYSGWNEYQRERDHITGRHAPKEEYNKHRPKKELRERFWSNVNIKSEDECWVWKLSKNKDGYGQINFNGKIVRTHRIAYILTNGEISEGNKVLHICDNPPCCNPKHLRVGTQKDNIDDRVNKKRTANGERNSNAKLIKDNVIEIRLMHASGKFTQQEIADSFGIIQQHVSQIVNNKLWKYI